jgi:transposase InsO family protein
MSHSLGRKSRKIFSKIKGYNRWMKTVISINEFDNSEVAKYRLKVINHYQEHGLSSTLDAYPIKRSTLLLWQQKLNSSGGKLQSLIPKTTKPHRVRSMQTQSQIVGEIARLRKKHWRLGKQKLKPLVDGFCKQVGIDSISVSTIGKVIKRHKMFYQRPSIGLHNPQQYQRKTRVRVKYAPKPTQGGYVEGDTVETRINNLKRYTISFIDVRLKVVHSMTFKTKSSRNTLLCFRAFEKLLSSKIHTVQTDNGSEFEGEFDQYTKHKTIEHVYTYPHCPKINGCIERYNRSVQEEWINSYLDELDDTDQFNHRLKEYLYFYNNHRVHESLGLKTPSQIIGREIKSNMY